MRCTHTFLVFLIRIRKKTDPEQKHKNEKIMAKSHLIFLGENIISKVFVFDNQGSDLGKDRQVPQNLNLPCSFWMACPSWCRSPRWRGSSCLCTRPSRGCGRGGHAFWCLEGWTAALIDRFYICDTSWERTRSCPAGCPAPWCPCGSARRASPGGPNPGLVNNSYTIWSSKCLIFRI